MTQPRILAIDLRAQLLGFAVLEGPRSLLDWGRKPFRSCRLSDNSTTACKKVDALLTFFAPLVVVLKHTSGRNDRDCLKNKNLIDAIKREAEMQSVELVFLTRKDVYAAFREFGIANKYEIARSISEIFPELAWKLPPNRKTWQPEHHNMAIFDAISLGLAYAARFDQRGRRDDTREDQ
jgi:hypothetical protein